MISGDLKLLGVYSGKDFFCRAENGDEWYIVMIVYITNEHKGELRVNDDESLVVEFFDIERLSDNIAGSHFKVLKDFIHFKS